MAACCRQVPHSFFLPPPSSSSSASIVKVVGRGKRPELIQKDRRARYRVPRGINMTPPDKPRHARRRRTKTNRSPLANARFSSPASRLLTEMCGWPNGAEERRRQQKFCSSCGEPLREQRRIRLEAQSSFFPLYYPPLHSPPTLSSCNTTSQSGN